MGGRDSRGKTTRQCLVTTANSEALTLLTKERKTTYQKLKTEKRFTDTEALQQDQASRLSQQDTNQRTLL
jgi:hypothetical protein